MSYGTQLKSCKIIYLFSDACWVKELRVSDTVSDENCSLHRSTRLAPVVLHQYTSVIARGSCSA